MAYFDNFVTSVLEEYTPTTDSWLLFHRLSIEFNEMGAWVCSTSRDIDGDVYHKTDYLFPVEDGSFAALEEEVQAAFEEPTLRMRIFLDKDGVPRAYVE